MNAAGLYVHIPFCRKKCAYCDFCSFTGSDDGTHRKYLKKLQKEIDFGPDIPISTVYIGGGTPTLLSNRTLSRLMDTVQSAFVRTGSCPVECTVESNPGTVDYYKLKLLKDRGVNRLSLGAQSFDDEELKLLGRIHDSEEIYKSYEAAIKSGFSNINLDLIFGLPGQSTRDWTASLKKAVKLRPRHISAYNLQIEEGTPFYARYGGRDEIVKTRGRASLPDNDIEYHMYKDTIDLLRSEGYIHYEISNFCLPGFECRHNVNYWENGEYLGVGLSACSHLKGGRRTNCGDLKAYLSDPVKSGKREKHSRKHEISETVFMGLRMIKGLDVGSFKKRFGISLKAAFGSEIAELSSQGLLKLSEGHMRLTKKGLFIADQVFERFV